MELEARQPATDFGLASLNGWNGVPMVEDLIQEEYFDINEERILNPLPERGPTMGKSSTNVLLVDDHPLYRSGLKGALLECAPELAIDDVGTSEEALMRFEARHYDLTVTDYRLGKSRSGAWLISEIKRIKPSHPVIALSTYQDEDVVLELLRAGADGYLPKTVGQEELHSALRVVLSGQPYVHPSVQHIILGRLRQSASRPPEEGLNLTNREREVLRLISRGMNPQEIACHLVVSVNTVKSYLQNLYRKFSVTNRADLLATLHNSGMAQRFLQDR